MKVKPRLGDRAIGLSERRREVSEEKCGEISLKMIMIKRGVQGGGLVGNRLIVVEITTIIRYAGYFLQYPVKI